MPVQPTGQCDQGSYPAFVQVSKQTPAGPRGFCAHHYDTNFAALVLAGCDPHQAHRGPETPGGQEPIMSKTSEPDIYQQEHELCRRLPGSPECPWAIS
jgi:hypothetical protein